MQPHKLHNMREPFLQLIPYVADQCPRSITVKGMLNPSPFIAPSDWTGKITTLHKQMDLIPLPNQMSYVSVYGNADLILRLS